MIKSYYVYDPSNGVITESGSCHEDAFENMIRDGHVIVEHDAMVDPQEFVYDLEEKCLTPYIEPEAEPPARELTEEERVREIKRMAQAVIERDYPMWKQLNILNNGTPSERDNMTLFIDKIRAISNQAEQDGSIAIDVTWDSN